jgi:hypothetical protein
LGDAVDSRMTMEFPFLLDSKFRKRNKIDRCNLNFSQLFRLLDRDEFDKVNPLVYHPNLKDNLDFALQMYEDQKIINLNRNLSGFKEVITVIETEKEVGKEIVKKRVHVVSPIKTKNLFQEGVTISPRNVAQNLIKKIDKSGGKWKEILKEKQSMYINRHLNQAINREKNDVIKAKDILRKKRTGNNSIKGNEHKTVLSKKEIKKIRNEENKNKIKERVNFSLEIPNFSFVDQNAFKSRNESVFGLLNWFIHFNFLSKKDFINSANIAFLVQGLFIKNRFMRNGYNMCKHFRHGYIM